MKKTWVLDVKIIDLHQTINEIENRNPKARYVDGPPRNKKSDERGIYLQNSTINGAKS